MKIDKVLPLLSQHKEFTMALCLAFVRKNTYSSSINFQSSEPEYSSCFVRGREDSQKVIGIKWLVSLWIWSCFRRDSSENADIYDESPVNKDSGVWLRVAEASWFLSSFSHTIENGKFYLFFLEVLGEGKKEEFKKININKIQVAIFIMVYNI